MTFTIDDIEKVLLEARAFYPESAFPPITDGEDVGRDRLSGCVARRTCDNILRLFRDLDGRLNQEPNGEE